MLKRSRTESDRTPLRGVTRHVVWVTLLALTVCALFPGGSSIGDEPLDLSAFLALADGGDGRAEVDDATSLRPGHRRTAYLAPRIASVVAASSSGVIPPLAIGLAAVLCKCLLSRWAHFSATTHLARRAAGERHEAEALHVSLAVATEVQFLS